MKATAIAAVALAAVVISCQLPAQTEQPSGLPQPEPKADQPQRNAIDFPQPITDQSQIEVRQGVARIRPEAYGRNTEKRVGALWAEFGKALNVAIQDEVITKEQVGQMLKELEAEIAIRRARLELLRAVAILDKTAGDAPQSEALHRLRQQLDEATGALRPRKEPTVAPGVRNARPPNGGYSDRIRRIAQAMLSRYDENKDGSLQRDEWSKMSNEPEKGDKNGDGQITLDELSERLGLWQSPGSSSSESSDQNSSK
jgi:hypothetical protein